MTDPNKELSAILNEINEKLGDIRYDLRDIKKNLPKVPYYGDLLEDIKKATEDLKR